MTLLMVELRRAVARRVTRMMLLLSLVGILIAAPLVFFNHQAADQGRLAAQLAARDRQVQGCIDGTIYPPGEPIEIFTDQGGYQGPAPPLGLERQKFCNGFVGAAFEVDPRFELTALYAIMGGTTVPLVLLGWLLGASFIGAEWRANTVATTLTWEPRRTRLLVAKALAAVIVAAIVYVIVQGMLGLALLPSALVRGTTAGADGTWLAHLAGLLGRGAALAAMAAAIGFAVGSVGKNTTAALGIGFVYLAVVEGGLLGGLIPSIRRWLIVGNSIVFVSGETNAGDVGGRTPVEAGLILAAYAAGAIAIATAVFRARDVT